MKIFPLHMPIDGSFVKNCVWSIQITTNYDSNMTIDNVNIFKAPRHSQRPSLMFIVHRCGYQFDKTATAKSTTKTKKFRLFRCSLCICADFFSISIIYRCIWVTTTINETLCNLSAIQRNAVDNILEVLRIQNFLHRNLDTRYSFKFRSLNSIRF